MHLSANLDTEATVHTHFSELLHLKVELADVYGLTEKYLTCLWIPMTYFRGSGPLYYPPFIIFAISIHALFL